MFTSAHMRKFGTTLEDLAHVGAKNHRNALDNPYAYFERSYSVEEIMQSKSLTENVRLLDCSMPCNGSAAILLAAENVIKKFCEQPVWITGIGQKAISAGFTKNDDLTSMKSTITGLRSLVMDSLFNDCIRRQIRKILRFALKMAMQFWCDPATIRWWRAPVTTCTT